MSKTKIITALFSLVIMAATVLPANIAAAASVQCDNGVSVDVTDTDDPNAVCAANNNGGYHPGSGNKIQCADNTVVDVAESDSANPAPLCAAHGGIKPGAQIVSTAPPGELINNNSTSPAAAACGPASVVCKESVSADCSDNPTDSRIAKCINSNEIITKVINPAIKVFSILVGVVAVVMLIIAGILYSSAQDDPKRISLAKKIIFDVLIGVAAYVFLFAFLNYVLPQGVG
jgi:hypothetical protein